jgi:hypothetical protein
VETKPVTVTALADLPRRPRDLLDLSDNPDRPCEQANALAAAQLQTVEAKIRQLQALREELGRVVDAACKGQAAGCRVIEALSDRGAVSAGPGNPVRSCPR